MLRDFEHIAAEVGITIPLRLAEFVSVGTVVSLASLWDFQFIDAAESRRFLADWLGRELQREGKFVLFPFGCSGGGDAYCHVVFENGAQGIAVIMHDGAFSTLDYPSVSHWLSGEYLQVFTNLQEVGGDSDAAVAQLRGEVESIAHVLLPEHFEMLTGFLNAEVADRPYRTGPRAREQIVKSLIAQDRAQMLDQSLRCVPQIEFVVIPEWEL